MVDVWNELGKALGRALKPLAEMGTAMWTAFGDTAEDLIKGFMEGAKDLKTTLEPTITQLMPGIYDEATAALTEGSPPEEIKVAVEAFVTQLIETVNKEAKTEGHSLPTAGDLTTRTGTLVGGVIGMYAVTHAISMALDATQPLKDWGFKTAIMDMLYQFNMRDVIGPMIQAPIFASLVRPLRMRASADYPYEIPGSGVLPYLHRKGLIDAEAYALNMKYHALSDTWQAAMLENVDRYPGFGDLRTMIHRGALTWTEARDVLDKSLMRADYLDKYEELLPSIPGLGDLVRFAVREAYPDADTFEEHYAVMSHWMSLSGFDQYFADAIWDAHWLIPTASQADEMLHRGMITEDAHRALYILNDIKPEYIDDLRALTWKLPGRIEARWMFRYGEIDRFELQDFLEQDGLSKVWSARVAGAMAKNQFLSDINRQIANSKSSYARGYSIESTLRSDLVALGLHSEIIEYHVIDAVADRERSIHDEELRTLRAQYARDAITMDKVITKVTEIIIDKEARDAWIAKLPTARQVIVMEETYGTEVNRLVTNAKYDYVRGYIEKPALVSRLQLLDLPDRVIEFHVMDADEDRRRTHNDKALGHIEEGYIDDVLIWEQVEEMAQDILVDKVALKIYLDGVWLNKHKAVRVFAGE